MLFLFIFVFVLFCFCFCFFTFYLFCVLFVVFVIIIIICFVLFLFVFVIRMYCYKNSLLFGRNAHCVPHWKQELCPIFWHQEVLFYLLVYFVLFVCFCLFVFSHFLWTNTSKLWIEFIISFIQQQIKISQVLAHWFYYQDYKDTNTQLVSFFMYYGMFL